MKLYYSAGSCSLAPHIVLREIGWEFQLEPVNLKTKEFSGGDYTRINPKGSVPALETENGRLLTEVAVILQYLADAHPEKNLIPKAGTFERYQFLELLNFVATEMHKGFSPLWNAKTPDDYRVMVKETLAKRFDFIVSQLGEKAYLNGELFTVVDAYLFTILNWAQFVNVDLAKWPSIVAYHARVKARPATQQAIAAEKLKS